MSKKLGFLLAIIFYLAVDNSNIAVLYAAKNPAEKFARGNMNVWNAQYELSDNVHESIYREGPLGFFSGVAKGTGAFIVRTASGLYDIIFFWLPIPKNHKPLVEPELNF